MSRTDVAAVVTCYNLGRTLDEALDSLAKQTLGPRETVIVDDGSTDIYTRQVLTRLEQSGHTVVRTSNRGVSAARNTGIALTKAPYIVLLDADDAFESSYLERAAACLDEDASLSFVSCGMACVGDADELWIPPVPDLIGSLTGSVVHISSMFRREMWESIGGFDETLRAHEEVDFWTTALERGLKGDVIPEPLLRYRVRAGSLYQQAIQRGTHVELMHRLYLKHSDTVAKHAKALILAKDAFILDQDAHRVGLATRIQALEGELAACDEEIAAANRILRAAGSGPVDFGTLRRTAPISTVWGINRGIPLDRYYIHNFLEQHRNDVRGRVLEVKDPGYTHRFGGDRVTRFDVIDIDPGNEQATIVADLTRPEGIPEDSYDCFILTQTLGLIYDVDRAVAQAWRLLRPGGVLLCTVPAAGRISYEGRHLDADFWRFTEASIRRLFAGAFPVDAFHVTGFGNVLACTAFLYGMAAHELTPEELDVVDPFFPVVYGIRAVKPVTAADPARALQTASGNLQSGIKGAAPPLRSSAAVLMYHRVAHDATGDDTLCLPAAVFREHMKHLREAGYVVLPLQELRLALATGDLRHRTVAITFDDGYSEMLTCVAPILAEFSLPATCFIVGETLNRPAEYWWDELRRVFQPHHRLPGRLELDLEGTLLHLSTESDADRQAALARLTEAFSRLRKVARESALASVLRWSHVGARPATAPRPMNAEELVRLARCGMAIGAHTESHVWLPDQAPEERRREISATKHRLQTLLNQTISSFAYPYGVADDSTVQIVRDAGFEEAVTTEERCARSGDNLLALPRIDVGRSSAADFAERLGRLFGDWQHLPAPVESGPSKTLVAGWFSFTEGHATAGDFLARDLACDWLTRAGQPYDVAVASLHGGSLDWSTVDPKAYTQVVFVCGPFGRGEDMELAFLKRFSGRRLIGLNLTMLEALDTWNPFDVLLERDSSTQVRPDIVFAAAPRQVPVVGVCLVEAYERADTRSANCAIERLTGSRDVAVVRIDTRLDDKFAGHTTPGRVESLIARMDVLVTTRLHGMVLALKNGVPVIAIDPEPGGAKILRQARAIGWPFVFTVDAMSDAEIGHAFERCLTESTRLEALECARRASAQVQGIRDQFMASVVPR